MISAVLGLLLAVTEANATAFVGFRVEVLMPAPGPNPFGLGLGVDVSTLPDGLGEGIVPDFGAFAGGRWLRARDLTFSFGPRVGGMIPQSERGSAYMPAGGVSIQGGPVLFRGGTAFSFGFAVQGSFGRFGYDAVFNPRLHQPSPATDLPRFVPHPGHDHIIYAAFDLPIVSAVGPIF